MVRVLPVDLRERVVAAIDGVVSCRAAAARFGVSAASAIRWRQQTLRTGKVSPRRSGGDSRLGLIEAHHGFIRSLIETKSDLTLNEIRAARWSALHRSGGSVIVTTSRVKKTAHATEQERFDMLSQRWAWFKGQHELDRDRLVFIDHTWAGPTWYVDMATADVVNDFGPAFPMAIVTIKDCLSASSGPVVRLSIIPPPSH